MTHTQFVAAYRAGRVTVEFDPTLAGKYLSARLLLPVMALPVIGAGVALALLGWIWSGLLVIALGFIVPRLIKRSAPHFLLTQALDDETMFNDALRAGVLRLCDTNTNSKETAS